MSYNLSLYFSINTSSFYRFYQCKAISHTITIYFFVAYFQESKHRKFFSRSASLRQAGSGGSQQASMELHVPGQGGQGGMSSGAGSPSQPQTQPSTPKKSNWEVIEHFNTSAKGGKAMVSSSLIAVSIRGEWGWERWSGIGIGRGMVKCGYWDQLIYPPNGQNVDCRQFPTSPKPPAPGSRVHLLWRLLPLLLAGWDLNI